MKHSQNEVNLDLIKDGLEELASKELQTKLWLNINNEDGLISSFSQAFEIIYEDSGLLDTGYENVTNLAPEAKKLLQQLDELLKDVDIYDRIELDDLDSLKMESIRLCASKTLATLR